MHFSLVQYSNKKKWSHRCGSRSSWPKWPMQKCGIICLIWYCTKLSLSISLYFFFTGYENMMENMFVMKNQSVTIYMLNLSLCVCLSGRMGNFKGKSNKFIRKHWKKYWKKEPISCIENDIEVITFCRMIFFSCSIFFLSNILL